MRRMLIDKIGQNHVLIILIEECHLVDVSLEVTDSQQEHFDYLLLNFLFQQQIRCRDEN